MSESVSESDKELEETSLATEAAAQDPPVSARVTAAPAATRKLIYHAEVRVKVEDLDRANARMDSLTRTYGAYVSDASETRQDGQRQHQMKIRVVPSRFQAMLGGLNGLGTLVSKTLSTDDVTAEHADISARLGTKRALEQRYIALLSQAKKVSDILEIEEKIGNVRGDIEATESRLKTLNDQVAYSTITLTYFQELPLTAPDAPVISFSSRLVQSFYDGWELFTGLVLALVTAWPLLLGAVLGVWGLRAWRQRRRQRAAASL
ncbi:DUF4349 domain-containing protein [Hymenobacter sp. YC55]|uniref:DUF4349 domain-containing protein n=1 Tax=Hymenobacter sp. YC55 TaxID=3034019 RepID=UPI0023F75BAF|nr:DUF4349 domain-containing protein [Hymenobacter sp. YC55]